MSQAYDRCQALLARLQAAHPEAKLTFGYIGNVYSNGDDDRSWMFWAGAYRTTGFYYGNAASFGRAIGTEDLDKLADDAEANLEAWVLDLPNQVQRGVYVKYEAIFNEEGNYKHKQRV